MRELQVISDESGTRYDDVIFELRRFKGDTYGNNDD